MELAYRCKPKGDVLAITGTNGKTTTTALLGADHEDSYLDDVYVVGKYRHPVYRRGTWKMTEDTVTVAEISSFQLETIDGFSSVSVSAILNITPDHLNRHHTMEEYIRVKERITKNQTPEDTCVLNYEDAVLREFGRYTVRQKLYFSAACVALDKGIYLNGENTSCTAEAGGSRRVMHG